MKWILFLVLLSCEFCDFFETTFQYNTHRQLSLIIWLTSQAFAFQKFVLFPSMKAL